MVKVLGKTFQILEHIASKGGGPVTPGELSVAVGLPHPTCMRILKDLTEFGYLVQVSRQKGYSIGPMCHAVARGRKYMQKLVDVADPLIKKCSETVRESVLLAVMDNGRRYILCHHNGNPEMHINLDLLWYDDLYGTATGRILTAHADEDELRRVLRKKGEPGDGWPETKGKNGLKSELQRIRDAGVTVKRSGNVIAVACPVIANGRFEAALGCTIFSEGLDEKIIKNRMDEIAATAKAIGTQCSTTTSLG